MTIKALTANNVTTFNITGLAQHHQLPDWVVRKNARVLKKDPLWSSRIQLIQDFSFPDSASCLTFTPDQRFIVAAGTYKPQIRVFDLHEMAMKFERHVQADVVRMACLSDDWQKLVLLTADRSIQFHNSSGLYYSTRIPKFGRAMAVNYQTGELLTVGGGGQIFRLNLDRGHFMAPLETTEPSDGGLNEILIGPGHGLIVVVGDSGQVEIFDQRDRRRVAEMQGCRLEDIGNAAPALTAAAFLDPMTLSVGDAEGVVRLFDLRSSKPLSHVRIDHKYGEPVKGIINHQSGAILSYDSHSVRITDRLSGSLITTVTPGVKINSLLSDTLSGFMAMAVEDQLIHSYYCPRLGPAPRWAAYLDNIVGSGDTVLNEDHQQQNQQFDNLKFLTHQQMVDYQLAHLIGTKMTRAYMHGFLVDQRLVEKAKAIHNPFALEEYRRAEAVKKVQAMRESRIRLGDEVRKTRKEKKQIEDVRFKQAIDEDDDYAITEDQQ